MRKALIYAPVEYPIAENNASMIRPIHFCSSATNPENGNAMNGHRNDHTNI